VTISRPCVRQHAAQLEQRQMVLDEVLEHFRRDNGVEGASWQREAGA
jgi:hypothetical protein